MRKIDYFLSGIVNGQYLEIKGAGATNKKDGGYSIDFHSIIAPNGWDPGIMLMICCSNLTMYSAKYGSNSDEFKKKMAPLKLGGLVGRRGYIKDNEGNDVVDLHAKGFLWEEDDTLYSRSIIVDGFSRLNAFGGIKKINNYTEEITPGAADHATGLANFSILTNNGKELSGTSVYPYIFKQFSLPHKLFLSVTDLNTGYEEFAQSNRTRASVSVNVCQLITAPVLE